MRREENKLARYRKKPIVVEAIQWNGENTDEILKLAKKGTKLIQCVPIGLMLIETTENTVEAEIGDFIIKGVKGEIYPCRPDIFHTTYELVE